MTTNTTITAELLDQLLANYEKPEDLTGDDGLFKQLKKALIERALGGGTDRTSWLREGAVAGLVGIEGGVVSGVINLESPGVGAPGWRPRHDHCYYEA